MVTDMAEPEADTSTAVVAHGLLGNLTVIRGAIQLLATEAAALSEVQRARLMRMAETQVELMQGVLTDLVRGLPSQALAALDATRRPNRLLDDLEEPL
jgi:hypothetical protein